MAKKSHKRKRQHFCVGGWTSKRDAEIDAKIFTQHGGHKAKVKPDGGGWQVCYTMGAKRRQQVPKHLRGAAERYTVVGPPRWRRGHYTSKAEALQAGHACSKQFPNAVCRVEQGLPGMQTTIAECNRNECYTTGGMGKRRRRKVRRR